MSRPLAHLANLTLNLLVALRELVRERNVTRAAEQFGISQPRRAFRPGLPRSRSGRLRVLCARTIPNTANLGRSHKAS
jgi:hypothetical protein